MGRAPCCNKDGLKKGPWTPEEDQKLIDYIQKNGCGSWRTLPQNTGLSRCGKSCRLRWTNYLRPDIKRGRFSFEEEETIIQLHSILGNKWSAIAARLPERTDNEIKNYWNTHIKKRLLRMGIDPVTHTPRLDLLHLSSLIANLALFNPASQLNASKLLGIDQLVNPEFLKIATNLLSNKSQLLQDQLFRFSNPIQEVTSCTTSSSPQFYNNGQSQFMQFQSNNADQTNLWQANGMQCNFLPVATTTATSTTMTCENLEQSVTQHVSDNTNFYLPNNQSNNLSTNSVLSTPVSSPSLTTQLNSSSAYINSSSITTEDERDHSYCSELFKFHIPDLLADVGEFF